MIIGNREFDKSVTHIMGILNFTPDSFSDGGRYNSIDKALCQTEKMIEDGADIIDVGGESTRPGYIKVSEDEEIRRTSDIIYQIKKRFDIPVSIDTYKSKVAENAVDAGADLINDIWGLKYDKDMASIVAKNNVACCLMHNRSNVDYNNFIEDLRAELMQSVEIARNAGIPENKIILDPGVGFGKTYEQNLSVIKHLEQIKNEYPMLLGTSRKSVIGITLGTETDERIEGTIVTTVMAAEAGYMFVRVHDVKANKRALMMVQAIKNSI